MRTSRILVGTLLAFVALAVLAVILAVSIDFGRFRDGIARQLSGILAREVRIEGSLSLRLGRTIEVRASGLVLDNPDWGRAPAMARIGRLALSVDTWSVLRGPVRLRSLEAEDGQLALEQAADGRANWQFGTGADTEADGTDERGLPVVLDALVLRNVAMTVTSPKLARPLAIRLDAVEHAVVEDRLRTRVDGAVNDIPLAFASDLGPRGNLRARQPVDFHVDGDLGEIALDAQGTLDDWRTPRQPSVVVRVTGPDVEYLLRTLSMPEFTTGPLDLSAELTGADGRSTVSLAGTVGEFRTRLSGWTVGLADPQAAALEFEASGPDLSRLALLGAPESLPAAPFTTHGKLVREAGATRLEDVELTLADARLDANATFAGTDPLVLQGLEARASGDELALFGALLPVPGRIEGEFELSARVSREDGQLASSLEGRVGRITLSASVRQAASTVDGLGFELRTQGPDLRELARVAGLDGLPGWPFRAELDGRWRAGALALRRSDLRLADNELAVTGDIHTADRRVDLQVKAEGPDLDAALTGFGVEGAPARPFSVAGRLRADRSQFDAREITAAIGKATIRGSLASTLSPAFAGGRFDLSADVPDCAALVPEDAVFRPVAEPLAASARGSWTGDRWSFEDATTQFAGARFHASGTVDGPPAIDNSRLVLEAQGDSLRALGTVNGNPLPEEGFRLTGEVIGTPGMLEGRGINAVIADSDARLDFTWRQSEVPEVELRLQSSRLDVSPYQPVPAEGDAAAPQERGGRVIPDTELPLDALTTANGRAEIAIGELVTRTLSASEVRMEATLKDGRLEVSDFAGRGRKGTVHGSLDAIPGPAGYDLALDLSGDGFTLAPPTEAVEITAARPAVDFQARLNGRGSSLRQLAGSLDGHVRVEAGEGKLPGGTSRLARFFFGDLSTQILQTVNPLSKQNPVMDVSCAVALFDIADGVVSGHPALVVQTRALNIFAFGQVDLSTEALSVDFNTRARRGIGISVSDLVNPATRIGGTMASPTIELDPATALVQGGAAVATGGLSFLAMKFRDRFLTVADPCAKAIEDYEEQEAKARAGK